MAKNSRVVLFALIKDNKILLEKRPVKGFLDHQYIIPGGGVKDLKQETLEQTLIREMIEELGATPIEFELLTNEDLPGLENNILKPFIVSRWEGNIPTIVLDKEDPYPLEWIEIDEALNISIEETRKIVAEVKKYLLASRRSELKK